MDSDLDKLERLHALFEQGALSAEEYQREKAHILSPGMKVEPSADCALARQPIADVLADAQQDYDEREPVFEGRNRRLPLALLTTAIVSGLAFWFFSSSTDRSKAAQPLPSSITASLAPMPTTDRPADPSLPPKAELLGKAYADALQGVRRQHQWHRFEVVI